MAVRNMGGRFPSTEPWRAQESSKALYNSHKKGRLRLYLFFAYYYYFLGRIFNEKNDDFSLYLSILLIITDFCARPSVFPAYSQRISEYRGHKISSYWISAKVVEFIVSAFDVLFLLMLDGLPEESRIFLKIVVTAYVLLAVFKNFLLTKMANQLFLDKDIFRDAHTYLSARHCF